MAEELRYWKWYWAHKNEIIPEEERCQLVIFTDCGMDVSDVKTYADVAKPLGVVFRAYADKLKSTGIIAPEVFIKAKNYDSDFTLEDLLNGCEPVTGYITYTLLKSGYGVKFAVPGQQPHQLAHSVFSRMVGAHHGIDEGGFVLVAGFDIKTYKKALEQYCPLGGVVYDPSMGWGNRLVACTEHDIVKYLGTDPSTDMWPHYNKYISEHTYMFPPDIRCQGSEVFVPEWVDTVDLVCTCPPYYNVEEYPSVPLFESVDTYKDFVYNTINNCYRYLKDDGVCMFYIGDSGLIKLSDIFRDAMVKVGLRDIGWYVKDKGNVGSGKIKSKLSGWMFGRK